MPKKQKQKKFAVLGRQQYRSIVTQVILCKGGILPPNTYYDCGSFVVNRKAVVGKEKKSYITAANSAQNGAVANEELIQ